MKRKSSYIEPYHLGKLSMAVGSGPVLILTHDNPDPDALASGKALSVFLKQEWNVPSHLVYSGLIARAENQAMLQKLTPEWQVHQKLPDLEQFSAIAMVDTQPNAGNNRLTDFSRSLIVFDHHRPLRQTTHSAAYSDIRFDFGSTVTMIYQYLLATNIIPDTILATAMFYGLSVDTLNLSRGVSEADKETYIDLMGLINRDLLVQIEQARHPQEYFQAYYSGLQAARISGKAISTWLGITHRPDMTADIADLLIRMTGIRAVLSVGQYEDILHVALRTESYDLDAGDLIQEVVPPFGRAGGHGTIAGGQILLNGQNSDDLTQQVVERFLTVLGETGKNTPLLES